MFYNLNGIPTSEPIGDKFFIQPSEHFPILKEGDITYEIETICIKLHQLIGKKIFGGIDEYNAFSSVMPTFIAVGGLTPEEKISKEMFEKLFGLNEHDEVFNRMLYCCDLQNLVSTLQNSIIETKYLFCRFYEILNTKSFILDETIPRGDGIHYAAGYVVVDIFSVINYLFINLNSQLDFVTKVSYEFEKLVMDFTKYPKLKSGGILFDDAKKIKLNGTVDTLFEPNSITKTIGTIRNELIHNASLESNPRVYFVIENNELVEKFILLPDMEKGNLKTFKNRKRFFGADNKLNEVLPELVLDFWKRLFHTLEIIHREYDI